MSFGLVYYWDVFVSFCLPNKSRLVSSLNPIHYTIQLNPVSSVSPSSSQTGFQIKKNENCIYKHTLMHKKLICFAQNINISRLERHLAKLSDVANMIMAILRFAPNYKSWQLSWDNLFYLTAPKVIMLKGKSDKRINWSSDSVKGRGQVRNKSSGSRNEPLIIVTMTKSTIS